MQLQIIPLWIRTVPERLYLCRIENSSKSVCGALVAHEKEQSNKGRTLWAILLTTCVRPIVYTMTNRAPMVMRPLLPKLNEQRISRKGAPQNRNKMKGRERFTVWHVQGTMPGEGVNYPVKASFELICVTTHNLRHQIREHLQKFQKSIVQSPRKKYDKCAVELIQRQHKKHESNHHQSEDGFPTQHDDRLSKASELAFNETSEKELLKCRRKTPSPPIPCHE